MENLALTAMHLHKQRMHERMEEARIERILNELKKRDGTTWQQRLFQRKRKTH